MSAQTSAAATERLRFLRRRAFLRGTTLRRFIVFPQVLDDDRPFAILAPPALERFREVTGVGSARLETRFDGWSKLALLTDDAVYLFPRRGRDDSLLLGAEACSYLNKRGVACAPGVVGRWDEFMEVAGPCVAFERRAGRQWSDIEATVTLNDLTTMLASLGRSIATWHNLDVPALPPALRRRASFDPKPTITALLDGDHEALVEEAGVRADVGDPVRQRWLDLLEPVVAMSEVLVHGDVCENQLLVDEQNVVRTVIDWDTAGLGHPLHDFDFGEWGFGIYSWERHFAELRREMWTAYASVRDTDDLPDADAVNLGFVLAEFTYFARHRDGGTLDAWGGRRLANTAAALRDFS